MSTNGIDLCVRGGEMGERIRTFDWSQTALGPVEQWPQSLKTSLSLILNAQMPMWLGWGSAMVFFYNDAYIQVLSQAKHPWALGRPAREVWSEIWHICGPLADRVFRDRDAPFVEDVRLFMDRGGGFLEEVYYSFSYSPIEDESGNVGGLFCPNTEVTAKLLNARRLHTLAQLSAKALLEKTIADACTSAAATLRENPDDIPFAIIYTADARGGLERYAGLPAGDHEDRWPIAEVFEDRRTRIVDIAPNAVLPLGLAGQAVRQAVTLPITTAGQERPMGVLVAGVNPTRRLDVEYATFYELIAAQVATAMQNALAVEETQRRADMLAQLDRAKTAFFSNVSHEFRTPLTLMIGPTEDALASPGRELKGASLETVYRNELRLLKLVNSLLDFSRIEAGRMEANYAPVHLATLTADIASGFRSAIERAGLRFEVDVASVAQSVLVDRDMWEKIVLNLLSNALKFTRDGGIHVTLRTVDREIELVVSDTGTGIPEHELPRLFERFHRVENPAARAHEGSGIGLALVHELTRLHAGTVAVDSTLGAGTTFRVRIPVRSEAPAVQRAEAPRRTARDAYFAEAQRWTARERADTAPIAKDTEHILLADDNADMRDYLRRLLEEHWTVTAVGDGNAALEAARRDPPNLVLTDVMMPGLDGFELLKAIHEDEHLKATPVILLSARADDEASSEGLAAGADDYLVKPFSARELIARVRTHLALARSRRQAKERLEETYALLMQIPAAISVRRGPDLATVFQNSASLELMGALPDEVAVAQRVWCSGITEVQREVAHGDRYWDVTWAAVRTPGGAIDGVMIVAFEVTDRVHVRAQVEAAEERRRLAFDASGVGTWRIELRTQLCTRDAALNRILGLVEIESTEPYDDFIARVHPDDRARVQSAIAAALRDGAYECELRVLRPDGEARWLRDVGSLVRDAGGRPLALTGAAADITERRVAEEERRMAQARLTVALAASDIGTYLWDVRTDRVKHDDAVKRLFGFAEDQGDQVEEYTARIHEADRPAWQAGLAASARDGVDFLQEYRVVRPDGTRWLLDKGRIVRDAHGAPAYMTGAVVDITEQKRLSEAALAASRAKDEFLAMLGHELRNPLAPIVTAVDMMKLRGMPMTKEQQVIERQVQHLTRLVDDLLDISRVTRGLIELKRERLVIREVIAKSIEIASPLFEQKAHHMSVDVPPGIALDGDPTRLAQVFANLLTNAARYTPQGGRIRIEASCDDRNVLVRVIDNGIGIALDMQARIFDLFEQGRRGAARSEGGLGIGLALVRSLVQLHGGTVSVASDGHGAGSTFEVLLPAVQELTGGAAADPEKAQARESGRRILLVDDNEDAALLLCEMLSDIGHEVAVAHDPAQALAMQGDFDPDVAILDIGLPVMDGYELARKLREHGFDGGLMIALTGYGQEQDRARSRDAGFDVHLVKPITLDKLAPLLRG